MNYLLFVYYDNTVENPEITTNEIGAQLSQQITSKEVKFMFGERHAIFHFTSDLTFDEMGGWVDIIVDDLKCFEYFLIPKPKNTASNFNEENLAYLLSLRKTRAKKNKPAPPRKFDFNNKDFEPFKELRDLFKSFKKPEVCDLSLDELLDKISEFGMESLTELERKKLDDYSKLN